MNRLDIRTAARKRLGETTQAFWTDAELNTYINQGLKDLGWRTKTLRAVGYVNSISCTSNTVAIRSNEYTLSTYLTTSYYALNEVYFNLNGKTWIRMDPTSREDLDALRPGWRSLVGYTYTNTATGVVTYNYTSTTSVPTKYYWDRQEDLFGVYPPPDSANSGSNYFRCYYTYAHADLATDTDIPTIPEGLHPACIDYVVAVGLEDRGWGDRANDHWAKYFKKISDFQTENRHDREDSNVVMMNYRNI